MSINNDFFPREIDGKLYFSTSQVAEILGQTPDWVSRKCLEGERFKNCFKQGGNIYYILIDDILENLDKMNRTSEKYNENLVERTFIAVNKFTDFHINNNLNKHPNRYSKDYVKGYKDATNHVLKVIQTHRGEGTLSELVGNLDE